MALSLSSSSRMQHKALRRSAAAQRPAARRVLAPAPRAFLGDALKNVADGFMKIFSKPQSTMSEDDWQSAGSTGFQGKISHHGAGRPFKDQWIGQRMAPGAGKEQAEQAKSSYLGEAVERVVGHNFTGDEETEPPSGAGSAGWKGDIHDRKTGDGFHSRRL